MFFSKATIVAFIATITLSSASPLSSKRQVGPTCETSGGSPNTVAVTNVINELKGNSGNTCGNDNDIASGCTTCLSHDSAAVGICGALAAIGNAELADIVNLIQQTCQSAVGNAILVGGQYTTADGIQVILFHS